MKKIILLILIVMFVSSFAGAVIVEWPVSEGGNGHFYEAVLESCDWEDVRIKLKRLYPQF